jgi:hexosaminidase
MSPINARAEFQAVTLVAVAMLGIGGTAAAAEDADRSLLPRPATVTRGEGLLPITGTFSVDASQCRDDRVALAATRLPGRVARWTGLRVLPDAARPVLAIHCGKAPAAVQRAVEDESYVLDVGPAGARLEAATPYGALRGVETFLQLVSQTPDGFAVAAARVEDRPRFPWRGVLIDSGRHFMPVDAIERVLDGMAAVKMNVLHWHLTEDQGFRVESLRFPRLHRMGSDGEFYTQDQLRGVVAHARARGIRVVPEFDMPGHVTSWLVGHPELAAAPGPYAIERRWGVFDPAMDPTREDVYRLLDRFLGEMAAIFPDESLHIGGDEVKGTQWDASPAIAEFKRRHGLASNEALQTHFNRRLLKILAGHGKSMVGWDEILQPDLPADAIVQSWRGAESLAAAASAGHRAILSSGYYLDHLRPASYHYAVDPLAGVAGALPEADRARILGGEACMWSEYYSAEMIDGRVWPRAAAIAERLWSPAGTTDVGDLYRRLELTSSRLEWDGLRHRSNPAAMLRRLAGGRDDHALAAFAALLEPLGIGGRAPARTYTSLVPLNRLVDALPPESGAGRSFAALVAAYLDDSLRQAGRAEIARRLESWARLEDALAPVIGASPLLAEIEPIAGDLAAAAVLALRALSAGTVPALSGEEQAVLDRLAADRAEVRVAVAPALARLTGGGVTSAGRSAP